MVTRNILIKNSNLLKKECKKCKTKKEFEIHHDVYPKTTKGILEAIKEGKIYYLCKKCHKNKKGDFNPL
jgi:cell division GTPase FtsZ